MLPASLSRSGSSMGRRAGRCAWIEVAHATGLSHGDFPRRDLLPHGSCVLLFVRPGRLILSIRTSRRLRRVKDSCQSKTSGHLAQVESDTQLVRMRMTEERAVQPSRGESAGRQ